MVFNKLRKGERRSIGHLRSPRGSIDETGNPPFNGNGSSPNSPLQPAASPVQSQSQQQSPLHIKLQQELARNAENSGTTLPSSPASPSSAGYNNNASSPTRQYQSQNAAARPQSIAPSVAPSAMTTAPSQPLYFPLATVHNPAAAVLSASSPPGRDAGWYMTTGVLPTAVAGEESAGLARSRSTRSSSLSNRGYGTDNTQPTSSLGRSAGPGALGSVQRQAAIPELSPATEKKYDQIYQATGLPDTNTSVNTGEPIRSQQPPPALNAIRGVQPSASGNTTTTTTRYSQPQYIPESQPQDLPLAVANAAGAAQAHRRQLSGSSPRIGTGAGQFPASSATGGKLDITTPAIAEMERRQQQQQQQGYDPSKGQSRFTEQMDLVGRTSEDTNRLPYFSSSSNGAGFGGDNNNGAEEEKSRAPTNRESGPPFSSLMNPTANEYRSGDTMPASEIAQQRGHLPDQLLAGQREGHPSSAAIGANPALLQQEQQQQPEPRTSQIPMVATGMSSFNRGALASLPAGATRSPERSTRGDLPVLPSTVQRVEDPALATTGTGAVAGAAPHVVQASTGHQGAAGAVPLAVNPIQTSPSGPREMLPTTAARNISPTSPTSRAPVLPAPETTRIQTYGPEQQISRVEPPKTQKKVIGSEKRRFTETPIPRMSHPSSGLSDSPSNRALSILPSGLAAAQLNAPQSMQSQAANAGQQETFGNVAQKIPHYMFVTYEAHVCEECVESDRRMHRLQHGGEEWAYEYRDPSEERELPLSSSEESAGSEQGPDREGKQLLRKTGRRDYQDKVSLVPSSGRNDGGQPCQCSECLKNRETVRYAAENGLIEKIFEGRRHPLSERIETITYTTIVRAPIIEETIETVWCEEPNCPDCLAKDEEYRAAEYRRLGENYPGAVIHETGSSASYEREYGAKNLWGLISDGRDGSGTREGENISDDKKRGLDILLSRAGHPKYNSLRGQQSKTEGRIVGGEDALLAHRERKMEGTVPQWVKESEGYSVVDGNGNGGETGLHSAGNMGLSYEGVRRALSHEDPEVPFSTQHANDSAARL